MSQKFHINKNGVPAPCKATKGNCPLGGDESHFDNLEEAQNYADRQNEKAQGLLPCSVPQEEITLNTVENERKLLQAKYNEEEKVWESYAEEALRLERENVETIPGKTVEEVAFERHSLSYSRLREEIEELGAKYIETGDSSYMKELINKKGVFSNAASMYATDRTLDHSKIKRMKEKSLAEVARLTEIENKANSDLSRLKRKRLLGRLTSSGNREENDKLVERAELEVRAAKVNKQLEKHELAGLAWVPTARKIMSKPGHFSEKGIYPTKSKRVTSNNLTPEQKELEKKMIKQREILDEIETKLENLD